MRRGEIQAELRHVVKLLREVDERHAIDELRARRAALREMLDDLGPVVRRKCHECGRSRPDEETTLVPAKVGGDYRRAASHREVRVCIDCTQHQVDYARKGQAERRNTPVNTGRISWEYAARYFKIPITGLRTNQMSDRVAP